jgi:transcriptional regulator with XRE-family HTH domain
MVKKFRTRLTELRKKHNVSRMDLVRKADMTYPTVMNWENDTLSSVNANTVWHLMSIFNCSMDELFYLVDDSEEQ